MIIDFHTHTFPDAIASKAITTLSQKAHARAFSDATAEGLVRSMDRAGIDLSVILPVATAPRQVEHINDRAAALNEGGRLLSFGSMHPLLETWEAELERIAEIGLKGIKIHPVYQDVAIDDPRFVRILKKCGELGLIVVMHAGDDIGFPGVSLCPPEATRRAFDKAGDVTLVAAHVGGWRRWRDVIPFFADTPILIDTSFSLGEIKPLDDGYYRPEELPMLEEELFLEIVGALGSGRVLFGTDSPWSDQETELERFRSLPLDDKEKEAILGGNARCLLGR